MEFFIAGDWCKGFTGLNSAWLKMVVIFSVQYYLYNPIVTPLAHEGRVRWGTGTNASQGWMPAIELLNTQQSRNQVFLISRKQEPYPLNKHLQYHVFSPISVISKLTLQSASHDERMEN
jgi:hypothetical protein